MAGGVPTGAVTAHQTSISLPSPPTPASLKVGTWGKAAARWPPVTASMAKRSSLAYCSATGMPTKIMSSRPPTKSVIAALAPR